MKSTCGSRNSNMALLAPAGADGILAGGFHKSDVGAVEAEIIE